MITANVQMTPVQQESVSILHIVVMIIVHVQLILVALLLDVSILKEIVMITMHVPLMIVTPKLDVTLNLM